VLAIELCVGSAESEHDTFDTIDGLILDKQYGAMRVSAAVWSMLLCGMWSALALS
jgi:hypothetical protein